MEPSLLLVQTASETPSQRVHHRGEEPDLLGLDLEVVGDQLLDQGPESLVLGRRLPLARERGEEEALGPLARTLAEALECHRRVAHLPQEPVERRDEIGRGIDERPVEIEQHHVHGLTRGRGWCRKAGH